MTGQLPTRITIELQPGEGAAGWTARTAVVDGVPAAVASHAAEPREDVPAPAVYEPAPCTCLEDGGCDADHAND
jgi:hypothetical protein